MSDLITVQDMQDLLDSFPTVGTETADTKAYIATQLEELTLWGWMVAQFWTALNLMNLAHAHPSVMDKTWNTLFHGSVEALRAGMEIWNDKGH